MSLLINQVLLAFTFYVITHIIDLSGEVDPNFLEKCLNISQPLGVSVVMDLLKGKLIFHFLQRTTVSHV